MTSFAEKINWDRIRSILITRNEESVVKGLFNALTEESENRKTIINWEDMKWEERKKLYMQNANQ